MDPIEIERAWIRNSSSIFQGWRERGPRAKPLASEDGFHNPKQEFLCRGLDHISHIVKKCIFLYQNPQQRTSKLSISFNEQTIQIHDPLGRILVWGCCFNGNIENELSFSPRQQRVDQLYIKFWWASFALPKLLINFRSPRTGVLVLRHASYERNK